MIDKIGGFRFPVSQPSVFDEEQVTALQLAARTAAKTNEVVDAHNTFVTTVTQKVATLEQTYADTVEAAENVSEIVDQAEAAIVNANNATANVTQVLADVTAATQDLEAAALLYRDEAVAASTAAQSANADAQVAKTDAEAAQVAAEAAADAAAASAATVSGQQMGVNITDPPYSVEADSLVDQSIAINAAFTAIAADGKSIFIPAGEYLAANLTLPAGATLIGIPGLSVLKVTADSKLLTLGDNCYVSGITFKGSGRTAIKTNQSGIYFNRKAGIRIVDCHFVDLGGAGVTWENLHGYGYASAAITNCKFKECNIGLRSLAEGEYVNVGNCHISYCTYGISFLGGNNIISNTIITQCYTNGVFIGAGANDGHGLFTGCMINHNTANVVIGEILNGYDFSGCDIMVGNIVLTECRGVIFSNCRLLTVAIYEDGCTACYFKDCHNLLNSITIYPNHNSHPSQVFYERMTLDEPHGGAAMSQLEGGQVSGVHESDVGIANGATHVMLFSDASNRLGYNTDYTLHDFYNPVTGVYTNFGLGRNTPLIFIGFQVVHGGHPTGVAARILVNGTRRVYIPGLADATVVRFALAGQLALNPGDTFVIQVINSSGDNVTLGAQNSYMEVRGL